VNTERSGADPDGTKDDSSDESAIPDAPPRRDTTQRSTQSASTETVDEAASRQPVCIFAPAPQLTITVEQTVDERADLHVHPGGQGIWVARMVRTLGLRPVVCSPFGGESGALARALATEEGFDVRCVETGGANGAYIDDRRGGERELLVEIPAAVLTRHELDDLYALTLEAAVESGVCVATGTHTDRIIPVETFRRLAADLRANDVTVVADLTGEPLDALLESGIDILKISHEELADAGLADGSDESVRAAIGRLRRQGARDVVVSRAEQSTLAAMRDTLYEVESPKLEVVEARGAGDSMTAGLAVGAALGLGPVETLQLAAAAGASNVTRHGVATGGREVIDAFLERVEVTELSVIERPTTPVRSGA
jgi:1-phosphofructokinase